MLLWASIPLQRITMLRTLIFVYDVVEVRSPLIRGPKPASMAVVATVSKTRLSRVQVCPINPAALGFLDSARNYVLPLIAGDSSRDRYCFTGTAVMPRFTGCFN